MSERRGRLGGRGRFGRRGPGSEQAAGRAAALGPGPLESALIVVWVAGATLAYFLFSTALFP